MYKISLHGQTRVGCNEDAWRLTPRIWFENKTANTLYGAAFTGSRLDGVNRYAPQSGMNEAGLVFSRLATHTPENQYARNQHKKKITDPTQYLKDILHHCSTVDEVKQRIDQFDHSYFKEDVFIYVDRSGKYLLVEPFTMTLGNEANYVLSNFCPSATSAADALSLDRYRHGVEFLKHHIDTSIQFFTALSDTMHVCRKRKGDGTLLTSIWNPNEGNVTLYFYHDYQHSLRFNLSEELSKGDHLLDITKLFPPNPEFQQLADYKIPHDTPYMRVILMIAALFFAFTSIYFPVSWFKTMNTKYARVQLLLSVLSLILIAYLYVLFRNINIYYFSAPYQDRYSFWISCSSYIPIVMGLLILPLSILNYLIIKEKLWKPFPRRLFLVSNITIWLLAGLFAYWGLFSIFKP
ncbi:MAG: hypothetical protein JNJ58_09850 [Chitinophagaceae bacterium]|nr:hypothetical protein [Chitinophagaceae bacterium]